MDDKTPNEDANFAIKILILNLYLPFLNSNTLTITKPNSSTTITKLNSSTTITKPNSSKTITKPNSSTKSQSLFIMKIIINKLKSNYTKARIIY